MICIKLFMVSHERELFSLFIKRPKYMKKHDLYYDNDNDSAIFSSKHNMPDNTVSKCVVIDMDEYEKIQSRGKTTFKMEVFLTKSDDGDVQIFPEKPKYHNLYRCYGTGYGNLTLGKPRYIAKNTMIPCVLLLQSEYKKLKLNTEGVV